MEKSASARGQKVGTCRTYIGQIPSFGKGWRALATCTDEDESKWGVFMQHQEHSEVWKTLKVVALERVERKANYWVAINVATGQLGFARDYALLRKGRPQLHQEVEKIRARLTDVILR